MSGLLGGGGCQGGGRDAETSSQKPAKASLKVGCANTAELSFQYKLWRRRWGTSGSTARPAVSRVSRKAWWSDVVAMYLASLGRVSSNGGR